MFYDNWVASRDLNDDGTCANEDVGYATQFKDRNVRYWYLGMDLTELIEMKIYIINPYWQISGTFLRPFYWKTHP